MAGTSSQSEALLKLRDDTHIVTESQKSVEAGSSEQNYKKVPMYNQLPLYSAHLTTLALGWSSDSDTPCKNIWLGL